MIGLTIQEIKNELLANNQDIVDLFDNEVFLKFDEFVKQNSKKIKIKNMKQYVGQTVGINTPDGFVVADSFIEKGLRNCKYIETDSGKNVISSYDHLLKTSENGFTKTNDLTIGDTLITINGEEKISVITEIGRMKVYDVGVNSVNHSFYSNDIVSHNSGKSFLLTNAMKCAQQQDNAFVLAIDSENALDYNYLQRVGVDISPERFQPVNVITVQDVVTVISEFIDGYIETYGRYNKDAPKVFVALDSISMLLTEAENDNFESGIQKGDQGQQAKQVKHFLKTMTSRMKLCNMTMVVTAHVYAADPLKGEGLYSVTPSLRYACSQIALITKLRLREDSKDKNVIGIRMKVETFKSRFAKLGSKIEVEVPYATGLNEIEGLLDQFISEGIVTQGGAWYTLEYEGVTKKFQRKDFNIELAKLCFNHPNIKDNESMFKEADTIPDELDVNGDSNEG